MHALQHTRMSCAKALSRLVLGLYVKEGVSSTPSAIAMASKNDMQVVVDDPAAAPIKPPTQPKDSAWLSQPRNRALTAGSLLLLIGVPSIVAPVVVTQQNKQNAARSANANNVAGMDGNFEGPLGTGIKVPGRTFTGAGAGTGTTGLPKFAPEEVMPYVKIENGQFRRWCRPYYPTGFNSYELVMVASKGNTKVVDQVFEDAASKGMTTCRTWAHSSTSLFPFQTAPGKYDPNGLKGLDIVLDSAARHNLTVILSFIDNWKYYNGIGQYMDWSNTAPKRTIAAPVDKFGGDTDTATWTDAQKEYEATRTAQFFSDPGAAQLYKNHVKFIVNRKNSVNGRIYKEDPTILAWNLINEPRCETSIPANADCVDRLNKWFTDMAAYVRSEDPNHLVTSGAEGFFGPSEPSLVSKNPADWAAQTGQDFLLNHKDMDFAVTHAWPDNWGIPNDQQSVFLRDWLQSHLQAAKRINKPLLFEEFGKRLDSDEPGTISSLRDPVYQSTFEAVEAAIQDGEPLLGSLYWQYMIPTRPRGPYGVAASDSTGTIIRDHAKKVAALTNSVPARPGCIAGDESKQLGAWFAAVNKASAVQGCVNNPEVSMAYYTMYGPQQPSADQMASYGFSKVAIGYAKALANGQVRVWATKDSCCAAGALGAFEEGCTAIN